MAAALAADAPPPPSLFDAYTPQEAALAARSPLRRQGLGEDRLSLAHDAAPPCSPTTRPRLCPRKTPSLTPPPPKKNHTGWERSLELAWPCVRVITRACGKGYLDL